MTTTIDGIPSNLVFTLETSPGTYSDVSNEVDRQSVVFSPAEPGAPRRLSFRIKRRNNALAIHEGHEMRIYVDNGAGVAYSRVYGGYVVDIDEGPKAQYEECTVTLACYNSLLTRGSHQITTEVILGGYEIWQPLTPYTVESDTKVVPLLNNNFYYACTVAGTSGSSQPTWPTVVGNTVTDGTVTWKCIGACLRTDKQAVEFIISTYLPECTYAVNEHVGNLPQITIGWETVQSALAKVAVNAGSNNYPVWLASTAYTVGKLIQAQPPNAYYYECTHAGTTASTPPGVWPTNLGDTVTSGTATFTCRGNVVVAPFAHVTVSPDNVGHTAAWNKVVGWYDLNSFTEIPTLSFTWTDITSDDGTHFRYDVVPKRHRDGSQYRNTQTVQGADAATATVTDSASLAYVNGRSVSGPIVKDDTLTSDDMCANAAYVILGAMAVGVETITFTSAKAPVDPYQLLQGVYRVPFTNSRMGLTGVQYYAQVGLDFSQGGVARWNWQLGAAPQSLGQNGLPRAMGGARFLGDLSAPSAPLWPAGSGWLLQNTYNHQTHLVDQVIEWLPPLQGLGSLKWYDIYCRHSDEVYTRYLGRVDAGVLSFAHSCNTGITTTYWVRAIGTEPGPLSTSQTAPAVFPTPIPNTPTITGIVSGIDRIGVYVDVTVAHVAGGGLTGDHSHGGGVTFIVHTGAVLEHIVPIPWNQTFPYTARCRDVAVGDNYDFSAFVLDQWDQSSANAPTFNYTVTRAAQPAPTCTAAIHVNRAGQYYATITVSHTGDHSRGGTVFYNTTGIGSQPAQPTRDIEIPPGATFPYAGNTGVLGHYQTYSVTAVVYDQYGQPSNTSTPITFTVEAAPPADFDSVADFSPQDVDEYLRNLFLAAGSDTEVSFADATTDPSHVPYRGTSSAKLSNGSGGNTALRGPKLSVSEGEVITLGGAVMRTTGLGTAPNSALKYQFYDHNDATVGSEVAIFDAIATTGFVYTEIVITAPATAKYVRWLIQQWDAGGHGTGYSSYFSRPKFARQQGSNQIADGAVTNSKVASGIDGAKLSAGSVGTTQIGTHAVKNANLDVITDSSRFAPDVQTGAFLVYDAAGHFRGLIQYNAGTDTIFFSSANATSNTDARLETNSLSLQLIDGGGGVGANRYQFVTSSGASVVLVDAALATGATDGFLYLGSCAGTPTGTPTARTGATPLVFDSTHGVLYAYTNSAWRAIGSTSGTAFPVSPFTGQRFFRTDLGVDCYYDGTRWLGPEIMLPTQNYNGAQPFSATTEALAVGVDSRYNFLVTNWDISVFIAGTSNGTNFWTLLLRRLDSTISFQSLASVTTKLVAANTWTHMPGTTSFSNNPIVTTDIWTEVLLTPTGAPGALDIIHQISGRRVYT